MELNHGDSIIDNDIKCTIDINKRQIVNLSNKSVLLQHDHNSERVSFIMSRYVDGHDMLQTDSVTINYVNGNYTGAYIVDDVHLSDDEQSVIFSWLISGNATQNIGVLKVGINFRCFSSDANVSYSWSTLPCSMFTVAESFIFSNDIDVYVVDDMVASFYRILDEKTEESIDLIEEKGNSVLDSIPDDYTQLFESINALQSDTIYAGNTEPTDQDYDFWLDPTEPTMTGITAVYSGSTTEFDESELSVYEVYSNGAQREATGWIILGHGYILDKLVRVSVSYQKGGTTYTTSVEVS